MIISINKYYMIATAHQTVTSGIRKFKQLW